LRVALPSLTELAANHVVSVRDAAAFDQVQSFAGRVLNGRFSSHLPLTGK